MVFATLPVVGARFALISGNCGLAAKPKIKPARQVAERALDSRESTKGIVTGSGLANPSLEGDDTSGMSFDSFIDFEGQDEAAFLIVFDDEPPCSV